MMREDRSSAGRRAAATASAGHWPERDGLLAALYLLDYVGATGKAPSELLDEVFAITGPHYYDRVDLALEPGSNAGIKATLDAAHPEEIAGLAVQGRDTTDGWRFTLEGGWLLFRLSGTEPLLRIYHRAA